MKIGRYFLIREDELLHIKQAAKLAGRLSLDEIDLILLGKMHLQRYPTRRLRVIAAEECQAETETYQVTGE